MSKSRALELLAAAIFLKESGKSDPFDNIHVRSVVVEHEAGHLAGSGDLAIELAYALLAEHGPDGLR